MASIMPEHYIKLFQRAIFKFIWGSVFEPISRKTLYLPLSDGGLNIPHIENKWKSILISHLQKFIVDSNATWTYFTKYWIGLQLRNYNTSFASNSFPHSTEYIPPFYVFALKAFKEFVFKEPDITFGVLPTKRFYTSFLKDSFTPKCFRLYPTINFRNTFKNIFSKIIDPQHKNICYRLAHDVVFVNYYLYLNNISTDKTCYFCNHIETKSHLFIECGYFLPLNRTVLHLLNIVSENKAKFSERHFLFFDLPSLENCVLYPTLVILSISRFVIWSIRNDRKYRHKNISSIDVINRFLALLRHRLTIDFERMKIVEFLDNWSQYGLCTYTFDKPKFDKQLFSEFYIKKFKL
jgi:hypothetical protein